MSRRLAPFGAIPIADDRRECHEDGMRWDFADRMILRAWVACMLIIGTLSPIFVHAPYVPYLPLLSVGALMLLSAFWIVRRMGAESGN
ncbi:MAG: hypothetical protein ACTHMG_08750 [Sphingomonas sp.]